MGFNSGFKGLSWVDNAELQNRLRPRAVCRF